ncbi:MAG: WD40/YVTN/BNR-like repeat-containing protein, partial [Acidobacteriota bacterium]
AVLWVGTGELNSQRSVGYGDGLYKSEDGGKSFRKVGLEKSEHIGRIAIDPRDSRVVYVAAQGPLWGPGGDRGLFKTIDGGKTWKNILSISEDTGVTEVVLDPRNPEILYASSWQRRRHVWTLINGGPESAIHKSTDGGVTWTKLRSGLPPGDLGRIGLAVSPVDPRVLYATVEAADTGSGIYRSTDRGATWEKMNPRIAQGMYYGQIICDPKDVDRIYLPDVIFQVSDDGGRTLRPLGERNKHVDNHTIWIDPSNTSHYLVGSDGGIYESHDRGATWHFKSNMPITQFYDVTVDQSTPFYTVCGGTQDNNTWCGPSQTNSLSGITNGDWFVTTGGDGFHVRIDPQDPNIIYSTSQYGVLVRYDRRTGERIGIQPKEGRGEPPLRWNWDSPLLISPHASSRIYFAANRLFRSDDRGDTWQAISPDLTRQIDRDSLPVMGRIWGPEAIAKHQSTSFYGNIVALAESPKKEGLIYVGTDDGLIQVTDDGGKNWRKVDQFPGVPERTFVARLLASQHDANTAYAVLNNHKSADFKPYLLKTTDAGKTWVSVAGNLPSLPTTGPLWSIAEDHRRPALLFVGSEFGLFFTIDGGQRWTQLKGGLPTIAVRDLAIQRANNDLVVGTFGRGIYILDNYAPLRETTPEILAQGGHLFGVRQATIFVEGTPFGGRGKASLGESFYTAENPPFGATFTYYLKEGLKTRRQLRREAERRLREKDPTGKDYQYPSQAALT